MGEGRRKHGVDRALNPVVPLEYYAVVRSSFGLVGPLSSLPWVYATPRHETLPLLSSISCRVSGIFPPVEETRRKFIENRDSFSSRLNHSAKRYIFVLVRARSSTKRWTDDD